MSRQQALDTQAVSDPSRKSSLQATGSAMLFVKRRMDNVKHAGGSELWGTASLKGMASITYIEVDRTHKSVFALAGRPVPAGAFAVSATALSRPARMKSNRQVAPPWL
jgi:hypothetical protein